MSSPHGYGPYGQPPPGGSAPPGQESYGQQPRWGGEGSAPPGGAYGSAYAPPAPQPTEATQYGDKAYEYGYMKRGRYSAWPYVVIAFLMEVLLIGGALGVSLGWLVGFLTKSDDAMGITTLVVGGITGIGGSYFVFQDRWRTIEAFSSRFCIGLMNISIMFVPIVALVYANVRGVRKLFGT